MILAPSAASQVELFSNSRGSQSGITKCKIRESLMALFCSKLFNWCPQFFTVRINWIDVIDFDYFEEERTNSVVRSSFHPKTPFTRDQTETISRAKQLLLEILAKIQRISRRNFKANQTLLSCFECNNCKGQMYLDGNRIICPVC